jgi:hypothetical protein
MSETREKFATQVDSEILNAVRQLAREEGRQIQALVNEALSDLIEKHHQSRARSHVMAAYKTSHGRYSKLYEKLAK